MDWASEDVKKQLREEAVWKLDLCGCGGNTQWEIVEFLLGRAEDPNKSFYDPAEDASVPWVEFGAKVLDAAGLVEHGAGIGGAWLTEDGELLLRFLREFGTDDHKWPEWAHSAVIVG